ncbi:MAG: hypothetical protein IJG61_04130, partial [Lachnospiraceae bacterium]|nr:hypothetical protein [Lachnospiraceae bacterium]
GSSQLSDGLHRFDDQAVQRIVSLVRDYLGSLSRNLEEIEVLSENGSSYVGSTDGTVCSERFIFRES